MYQHTREAKNGHKCQKCNVIRKIWREDGQVGRRKVFTTTDEQAAYDFEAALIASYGLDTLTNQKEGGAVAFKITEESRQRMCLAAQNRGGHPHTPESKAKIGAKSKQRGIPAEVRDKATQWHRQNRQTLETRAKISAGIKAKGEEWSRQQAERARAEIARRLAAKTTLAGMAFTCARPGCGVTGRRSPSQMKPLNYCCYECSALDRPRFHQIRNKRAPLSSEKEKSRAHL